jgi:hypothetical protein
MNFSQTGTADKTASIDEVGGGQYIYNLIADDELSKILF